MYTFSQFTLNSACTSPGILYTATLADGSLLPSLIHFTSTNRTFTTTTSSDSDAGTYAILVIAKLSSG